MEGSERSEGWKGSIWPREEKREASHREQHETRKRRESALRWHGLLHCNLLQSAAPLAETGPPPQPVGRWQTTTVTLPVDIAHNLREDFTGLYWWHGPIRHGRPPRCLGGPPRQGSQGRFSTLFGLCGCWSREVQVVEGSWAIPDRPGRSWAVLGCPGLSRLSWVAGCGTFTASDASSQ